MSYISLPHHWLCQWASIQLIAGSQALREHVFLSYYSLLTTAYETKEQKYEEFTGISDCTF